MRVRELAHRHVATLRTVERTPDGDAWLVWDYLDGVTFGEHVVSRTANLARLTRDVILAVESLHALGIVHGALHERNIIVSPDGQIRLTHISPLLYSDPAEDVAAIAKLFRSHVHSPATTLRQLALQLSTTAPPACELASEPRLEFRLRRRSIWAATIVTALAILTSLGLYRAMSRTRSAPSLQDFDRLDTVAPVR
jgi:serine/threonine protein kinase